MRTQRPGTFRKGHKKIGGRKKGSPNRLNRNLTEAIVQAGEQFGSDGKGKDGIGGYLKTLAGENEGQYVTLLRQAVQKQVPTAEPENEVIYSTEQDYRQALLDRGVHPTLLPPPPRDLNEKPPVNGKLLPPKPPPGWEWVLCKTNQSAELDKEQPDPTVQSDLGAEETAALDKEQPDPTARLNAEEDDTSLEIKDSSEPDCPWPPIRGWRWEYNPCTNSWFAVPAGSPRPIWI